MVLFFSLLRVFAASLPSAIELLVVASSLATVVYMYMFKQLFENVRFYFLCGLAWDYLVFGRVALQQGILCLVL